MSKAPLTSRQESILTYIKDFIRDQGYSPSYREIGQAHNIRSPYAVQCHLKALQRKGWIQWEPLKSRTVRPVA
jgi:repressor LexA